jgi:hypothetical protein
MFNIVEVFLRRLAVLAKTIFNHTYSGVLLTGPDKKYAIAPLGPLFPSGISLVFANRSAARCWDGGGVSETH